MVRFNIFFLVFLFIFCLIETGNGGMTLNDYRFCVEQKRDRQYNPITPIMCFTSPRLRNLKSCVLLRRNATQLKTLSAKFLAENTNRWNYRSSASEQIGNPYVGRKLTLASKLIQLKYRIPNLFFPRRSKRGIPGNPCQMGRARRATILYGVDAETGKVLELYQDPANRLYQTFFTHTCSRDRFLGFNCAVQYVEFLAAVYKEDSHQVITRPVKIPINCAINVG